MSIVKLFIKSRGMKNNCWNIALITSEATKKWTICERIIKMNRTATPIQFKPSTFHDSATIRSPTRDRWRKIISTQPMTRRFIFISPPNVTTIFSAASSEPWAPPISASSARPGPWPCPSSRRGLRRGCPDLGQGRRRRPPLRTTRAPVRVSVPTCA